MPASPTRVAFRYLSALDRYPPIRVPRGWRPPYTETDCPDFIREENVAAFRKEALKFMQRTLLPALKQRGWKIDAADLDDYDSFSSRSQEFSVAAYFEVSAKAGQKIGLGGRNYIVLDRNLDLTIDDLVFIGETYEEQVEESQQFDVDEFAEWTAEAQCPSPEVVGATFNGKDFQPNAQGVDVFLKMFDLWWMRKSAIRSKIQKRASALDGMPRRKVMELVNKVIGQSHLNGFFSDQYWKPIQGLWKNFEKAGIPFGITKSDYEHEEMGGQRVPVRKVWRFEVEFLNERGRPTTVYGQVVAAGAGPVDDPLAKYDVTAYAN